MKTLTIKDPALVLGIQDEIRRNNEARYDHRLHAVLLVGQGMTCPRVASYLGDASRTIQNWVNHFEEKGFAGLSDKDGRGRKPRLAEKELEQIGAVLRCSPEDFGMSQVAWDGKTLAGFIKRRYGVRLGVRQCQRLFRKLGFRFRKPRPLIAHADEAEQKAFKKTQNFAGR